jgi:hypothetical protein
MITHFFNILLPSAINKLNKAGLKESYRYLNVIIGEESKGRDLVRGA